MRSLVTSYVNPDLDGVACAIVVADTEPGGWRPSISGHVNEETKVVLRALRLSPPSTVTNWDDVTRIWLVDTHHLSQLPATLPAERVTHVVDHHTGGDPAAFPNAAIQNEAVGAAATLIAERQLDRLSLSNVTLLQCAILSNTLEFRAPATSERDRAAFDALRDRQELDPTLRAAMRAARQRVLQLPTWDLLLSDVKHFQTRRGRVVVSQIEAEGGCEVLSRDDLAAALSRLAADNSATAAVINLVDPAEGRSAVLTTDPALHGLLAKSLGVCPSANYVLFVDRVLQRKTDIVPALLSPDLEEQ